MSRFCHYLFVAAMTLSVATAFAADAPPKAFLETHCSECHDASSKKGGLDLGALPFDLGNTENFARWVKVFHRVERGEMPPKKATQPAADERKEALAALGGALLRAEEKRRAGEVRTGIRRLTRAEYENTIRDLFDLPGLAIQGNLPADGAAHGFDKNSDALDISHVNLSKYVEAANLALDTAIATMPQAPKVQKQRISLANPANGVAHVMLYGEAVFLKNKQIDPEFPPAAEVAHIDQGAHQQLGLYNLKSSVGLFRHEDESFQPYFLEFATIYPARYRLRTSLWSFQWDKGKVLPSRGTEAGRLSAVHLQYDGRHTGHPSDVIGYFDAPSLQEKEHDLTVWLNYKDTIGFNAATLVPGMSTRGKMHALGFSLPGIACDWFDVEGPLFSSWPPEGHKQLFGDLPIVEFKSEEHQGVRPPARKPVKQEIGHAHNRPDEVKGIWTVGTDKPLADADKLLASFLPKAFRRPVDEATRKAYVAKVDARLQAGDCFESAMRWAYRAALCSPDFLYHYEPAGKLDDHAIACRLSYFLWNSLPDDKLTALANAGKLRDAQVVRGEIDRMIKDPKSQRFVEDFLGQWLKLRQIAATDPDKKLYPEFNNFLMDSMVAETRAYFRELIEKDLDATHIVRSDFAMLNEKLARHYGIEGVTGTQIRRVQLPADSPRGGFLTHGSILKITANGTTTSPVPRGAFVLQRILGEEPDPPPGNVPAIEPDVRGTKTIREQLAKHREDQACASCHANIDPPGFALESFDVIGGFRTRYRSMEKGDPAPQGNIDKLIWPGFKLGPAVDCSGVLPDERSFKDIHEYRNMLAADPARLLTNMAKQFAVYSTGREIAFRDRQVIAEIVAKTQKRGGGLRSLIHELVASELFQTR